MKEIILSAIIPVLIAQIVAIIVTVLNNRTTIKKLTIEKEAELQKTKSDIHTAHEKSMNEIIERSDKTIMLIETKLEALTKQVEKHNSIVERMYAAEKELTLLATEDERQNARLKQIENELHNVKGA